MALWIIKEDWQEILFGLARELVVIECIFDSINCDEYIEILYIDFSFTRGQILLHV
jgi:hypothetical protein